MKLLDITAELSNIEIKGNKDIEIKGIAYDSRMVAKDYLFVCIQGYKTDGHLYIEDAIMKGASAIVVEKDVEAEGSTTLIKVPDARDALALMSSAYFGHPTKSIKLIGITGTNGKTTTTYMIKSILEKSGYKVALLGTISNIIGNNVVEAKRTTPESYDLQEIFNEIKNEAMDYCVMEVSSHSLELKRVAGCIFNVGIFTNLTRDHLDFHGNFQNYFNAKLKLFAQSKMASVNVDDTYGQEIVSKISIPTISFSEQKDADLKATDVDITSKYSNFTLNYKNQSIEIKLPLPGKFNVYNSLAAASACIAEGITLEKIKEGLEGIERISGRSEVIDSKKGFTIVIDYAHTPDGLENILNTIHEYAKGRIITLFGCGGDRDKTKRPLMGEISGRLSDISIVTSDNPRTEDPQCIINDIVPGIMKVTSNYRVISDRREAIREALSIAMPEDVVVIAGKGHETYQILKDRTIHFDEREIVHEILENEL